MVISAQVKTGKSAVVGALVASVLVADRETENSADVDIDAILVEQPDLLGFKAAQSEGKAIILFDTEHSRYDAYGQAVRIKKRSGVSTLPGNYFFYTLVGLSASDVRAALRLVLDDTSAQCGGIHSVLLDGVADLCADVNDPMESGDLVVELMAHAANHCCPMVCILHENPASPKMAGKTRGHLGSQLERKAESNLRVVKTGEISVVYGEKCRSSHIPEERGPRFQWSDEKMMHVSVVHDQTATMAAQECEKHRNAIEAVFEGIVGPIKWGVLKERVMNAAKLPSATAERRIREWEKLGMIQKWSEGGYVKV